MRAWFRQIAVRLNASYWFLPALLTSGAILLSFVTYYVDLNFGGEWVTKIAWMHESKPDGARELLSTIAGSMISVAGTVFAITIAAVVYASGNYGPRLLTNFMTDRGNQLSLGVFIATFVYCLLVLRTVRQPGEEGPFGVPRGEGFVPELSLLVAFLLALLSVVVLVYFLHHVPDSIRINRVVATIGGRAVRDIERRYPDADSGKVLLAPPADQGTPLTAKRIGYIEVIDFTTLCGVCRDADVTARLAVRVGDFVHPEMPLLHFHDPVDSDIEGRVRNAFALGFSRTSSQDIEYSIDELVEIALRALSPGINDPFTAITCIHWLSAATAALAGRDLRRDADGEPYGAHGVYGLPDDFAHFLRRGFGAMRASAAASPLAAAAFVDGLRNAELGCRSEPRRAMLRDEALRLLAQAETEMAGPSLAELRARVGQFDD